MRRAFLAACALACLVAVAGESRAAPVYVWGAGPANWNDADKANPNNPGPPDGTMCWAAAAANALAWSGWPGLQADGVTQISTADGIFAFFKGGWPNDYGNVMYGYDWWFENLKTDPTLPPTGDAGFYAGNGLVITPGGGGGPGYVYGGFFGLNPPTETSVFNYISPGDKAVTIGVDIDNPLFGAYRHSLTVWGIDTVAKQLWYTDSDDGVDALKNLFYTTDAGGHMTLLGYTNVYQTPIDAYIDEAVRLNVNTGYVPVLLGGSQLGGGTVGGGPVPEPVTLLLMAAGFAGFGFRFRRARD